MKKGNVWALLPIFVFLILFLGGGIIAKDMYAVPTLLCFLIALVVALFQNSRELMETKMRTFARGIGDKNIITMILIFLTAGMFTGAVDSIGGVESTVNFGLSILPPEFAVLGLFITSCFISMAMGTSVGTITALAPIGYGISVATGFPAPLCIAAVVSGAMFGDNLSMVSDTTIAAVNTQGCNMKDKFKQNFFIVLPAAIIAMVVFVLLAMGKSAGATEAGAYNFWKIVPYLFVLVSAILGLNVFMVLTGGTILAVIIGLSLGDPSITFFSMIGGIGKGMGSMYDISLISLVVAGIVELIKANGGIDAIIYAIKKCVKGKRGAELGIAVLVTLVDFFTANNTVAIVIAGPIAKDIADEFDITPKRSAAILDIFASFAQGIIPYGAQLLTAGSFVYQETEVSISPLKIMPYLIYPYVMMLCALIFIIFFSGDKKKKKALVADTSQRVADAPSDTTHIEDSVQLAVDVECNASDESVLESEKAMDSDSLEPSTECSERGEDAEDDALEK